MKRITALLSILLLLLSGCAIRNPATPPATLPAAQTEPSRPEATIMDGRAAAGSLGNVWYLPNDAVASMGAPTLYSFGGNLLLVSLTGDETGFQTELKLISQKDGTLLAERVFAGSGCEQVQTGPGGIGLYDSVFGTVQVLDEALEPIRAYTPAADSENWALSGDMQTLYILSYQDGVFALNLDGGEKRQLLDGTWVSVIGRDNRNVIFTYVDRRTQRSSGACLNLETGNLEAIPASGTFGTAGRAGDIWLLGGDMDWNSYRLLNGDKTGTVSVPDGWLTLLDTGCILKQEYDCCLTLYSADGRFLSRCERPRNADVSLNTGFVWSDLWNGYFFTDYTGSATRLLFWDPTVAVTGENLALSDVQPDEKPEGTVLDQAFYARADELSRRFALDIRIADCCTLDYSHYDSWPLTEPEAVWQALDVLEAALSAYPDGFFPQLLYGPVGKIQIEIVGGLTPKADAGVGATAAGFTQQLGDHNLMALDGWTLDDSTIFHEFSHMIDARLRWDADLRENALFSEERWLKLQPEGFEYAYSYEDIPERVTRYYASGYFAADYACTFPTEDRATLMAAAMTNATYEFDTQSGLRPKMDYYSRCIRDCFDTAGWPAQTAWERILQSG